MNRRPTFARTKPSSVADLRLFLTHLAAAIQTADPEVGVDTLALLEGSGSAPGNADVLADPMVVALDDHHADVPGVGPGRQGSSRHSRTAIGSSWTTSLRRCWSGSRTRCARSCSTRPCSRS